MKKLIVKSSVLDHQDTRVFSICHPFVIRLQDGGLAGSRRDSPLLIRTSAKLRISLLWTQGVVLMAVCVCAHGCAHACARWMISKVSEL